LAFKTGKLVTGSRYEGRRGQPLGSWWRSWRVMRKM